MSTDPSKDIFSREEVPGKGLSLATQQSISNGSRIRKEERTHISSLTNLSTFPAYVDLPGETEIDGDYYGTQDGRCYYPEKHWCFFGEITDSMNFLRLQIELRDRFGDSIPVYFYTDARGSEINPLQIKRGHTVAILYAEKHFFMDGQIGIRHEIPEALKEHGWKEKRHKLDCKSLQDHDLRGLFLMKWDEFTSHQTFPLSFPEVA
ncbi:unnamed protein product [Clonostachys rosea]|uniref:Uncharacterized protein n=1 Tax=Bionectria ochroleuca TaxID=29856 RepID=A0ABY6UEZ8_BIOOC|nr:unnamed protein product [Clonostachys rosea]